VSWLGARAYAYLVWFMAKKLGVWLPGLGFVCRHVRGEHIIRFQERKYLFSPEFGSMYGALIVGKSMEPETHLFFRRVIPQIQENIGFVDVGAAIGEMVIHAAGYRNVDHVIAFDPDPENVMACRRSAAINGFDHVSMRDQVVADEVREMDFELNRGKGTSGRIASGVTAGSQRLISTTLDREIPVSDLPYLVLIDVEGAEILVIRGGAAFIRRHRPLIVFEYITGRDQNLPEVGACLGEKYEIYRLRDDGYLDTDMRRTWNCVAVHQESVFYAVCRSLSRA